GSPIAIVRSGAGSHRVGDSPRPTTDVSVRAARRQLLEATDDDTGRPRVPACYRRLTSVNPAQLLAVAAVFCALAHVVTREKRREGVPAGLVVRVVVAAVALPPLRGLQPVRAIAHHVRPGMLRAA